MVAEVAMNKGNLSGCLSPAVDAGSGRGSPARHTIARIFYVLVTFDLQALAKQ